MHFQSHSAKTWYSATLQVTGIYSFTVKGMDAKSDKSAESVQAGCGINAFQVVSKFEYFSHADLLSKKYFWFRNNQKLPVIGLDAKLSCRQDETAAGNFDF